MTAGAYAQDDMTLDDGMSALAGKKYTVVTNGFWTNWFVEASATMPKFDKVGMSMAIGKWFSPSIGVRTKFNAFRAKAVEEQVMFNLSTILCGYNAKRVYHLVPYVGGGMSLGSPSLLGVSAGAQVLQSGTPTPYLVTSQIKVLWLSSQLGRPLSYIYITCF